MNEKTGRLEYVFVDLASLYFEHERSKAEYCFEEVRARHRGWLDRARNRRTMAHKAAQPSTPLFEGPVSHERSSRMPEERPGTAAEIEATEAQSVVKHKQRGFKIFEDESELPPPASNTAKEAQALASKLTTTSVLNDENDENAPRSELQADLTKRLRREERANRTRKIQVMDVKHIKNETKTIQLKTASPTGVKLKRKKSGDRAEPTMTINTKEAMDEIYGIFSQPLPSQAEQTDGESEYSDDDNTTDGESTGTGKLSEHGSEYGDETRNEILAATTPIEDQEDAPNDTGKWSDFTTDKAMHEVSNTGNAESTGSSRWEGSENQPQTQHDDQPDDKDEEIVTPQEDEQRCTRYVPLPPEGYKPPTGQYRDTAILANNRLPFMTPIVEQTESSLSVRTVRTDKDYFSSAKTPSRKAGVLAPLSDVEELCSSPFQEIIADTSEDKRKVLQPIRTKTTKGTISLGQGTAKSQLAVKEKTPSTAETSRKGPIIQDVQCNPMDPQLRATILSQMKPSLSSFEGYHEHPIRNFGRTPEIRKYIRTLAKASKSSSNLDKTASTLSLPPMLSLPGADGTYTIKRELGAGTFAPVYLIENSTALTSSSSTDHDNNENNENRPPSRVGKATHRKPLEVIKMEDPPSTWEFYILRQTHRRLGVSRAADSIIRAHEMHLFRDECFLVEEFRSQGTLLDLVNVGRIDSSSGGLEEPLAMFLTVELFRTIEALHAKNLIHGDLKGDNVLVRFDDHGPETDWSATYFPSGAHGWASKGICLIDMGRGIDMKHFRPDVAFIADWKTSEADCAEMRELRPWTYQIDYYGLAGIVHSLLFGKYMETLAEKAGSGSAAMGGPLAVNCAAKTYRIREGLKRYWQTEIWGEVFTLLLNPLARVEGEEGKRMPVLRGMRSVRERMEGWLEENCERGVGLKGMVGRMEGLLRERRKKGGKAG